MPAEKNMHVLIVDDFQTMRRIIRNIFKQLGYDNVDEADHGQRALEMLNKAQFDFVVSDWNMPVMNGLDLLKAIKASEKLKHIPVMMVTAEAQKDNVLEAIKAGASNYVVKPFSAEALQEKIVKIFK